MARKLPQLQRVLDRVGSDADVDLTTGEVADEALDEPGAPVVEELFYRGLLLRSLQRYLADGPAVVLSGLVFAASHFELLQLPALAVVGVFLAVLVVRTGRLGPAIWCHIAFNTVTVVALALER